MINQAVVLAAGLGERLRPLTLTRPKPLLEINGKPLLIHVLSNLQQAGIKDVVVHVAYLGEQVINTLADAINYNLSLNISYAVSKLPIGTGGGIYLSKEFLKHPDKPFICVNSDIYTDYDYSLLCNLELDAHHNLGHLVLVENPSENLKGDFDLGVIKGRDFSLSRGGLNKRLYTFSGIAAYHPSLVGSSQKPIVVATSAKYSIIEDIDANIDRCTASIHQGLWSDIGTLDRLQAMQRKISC